MNIYQRVIKKEIINNFFLGEVIMLIGARQVGKTFLLEDIIKTKKIKKQSLFLNADYLEDREILNQQNLQKLKRIIGDKKYIFIDEGQKVENIGNTLKILVNYYKQKKQITITGSSSIHLLDQTAEPLTGRKYFLNLYPLSVQEIVNQEGALNFQKKLEENLIFGSYPKVLNQISNQKKIQKLKELVSSNLYRDILEFQLIKNPAVLTKLLKILALQIGSEVSLHKTANLIGLNLRTVERYIDLLEKSYIVFRLPPFYTNKKKEITKMNKIYFFDLGIRNALINDFNSLENRNDLGNLFENYFIVERMKANSYRQMFCNQYFWKHYNKNEIDLIEDHGGQLKAFEIKWKKQKISFPKSFQENYQAKFNFVCQSNMLDFLL